MKKPILMMFLTAVFLIFSCGKGKNGNNPFDPTGNSNPKYYTVTFNTGAGGNSIDPVSVLKDNKIIKPSPDPLNSDTTLKFAGWYQDAVHTQLWDFDKILVTSDTNLYAKWALDVYKVYFDSKGGSSVTEVEVESGKTITTPTEPTKTGYAFAGWYKDSGFTKPWDFTAEKVTANTTLYAKWNINTYSVNFESNGGTSISSVSVEHGLTVIKPSDPKKFERVFVSWYKDSGFTQLWNFATDTVTANITLYAKWSASELVDVTSFYIGKFEVTKKLWQSVMGSLPSGWGSGSKTAGEIQELRPVENVSWYDTLVFCNTLSIQEGLTPVYSINGTKNPTLWGTAGSAWDSVSVDTSANGYRLPTNSEWEYAAKGGQSHIYSGSDTIGDVAWYDGNSADSYPPPPAAIQRWTHQVGLKMPNAYGIYDMTGNVLEWCFDWFNATQKVYRGGAYYDSSANCAVIYARANVPTTKGGTVGFRIVRNK